MPDRHNKSLTEVDLRYGGRGSTPGSNRIAEAAFDSSSLVTRALAEVREMAGDATQRGEVVEWFPDPRPSVTGAGRRIVHLYQHYRGIPVFQVMHTVIFPARPAGDTSPQVSGEHVPLPDGLPLSPELDAPSALLEACRHLGTALEAAGERVTDYPPSILSALPLPAEPTLLHKLPFEDPVRAYKVYFVLGGEARLSWLFTLSLPSTAGAWEVIVDAVGPQAGRILRSRNLVSTAGPARGRVWPYEPEDPDAPARRTVDFPVALSDLPPIRPRRPLPSGFPPSWVDHRGTAGNNAEVKPFGGTLLTGQSTGGVVLFAITDPQSRDQQVLNAFFWCNYLHDLFYLLGFDEDSGNFQKRNFSGAPRANDRLRVFITRETSGDAEFLPREDGRSPRMSLGETVAGRHTALSADVVIHELVHGFTNRLVGGSLMAHPMDQSFQSRALDEGTCDWFALTVQNHARLGEGLSEKSVFGAWAADDPVHGLRPHAYANYPFRFGDLADEPSLRERHSAGQVWCATLLEMNRRLGVVLSDPRQGHELGWQAVTDALKETPTTAASITYMRMRKRILDAIAALGATPPARAAGDPLLPPARAADALAAARESFAVFGMGPAAVGDDPDFADATSDPP